MSSFISRSHLIWFFLFFNRIYSDQLAALSGLTAYPLTATAPPQGQTTVRYITTTTPQGLSATGQPTGAYTIGYRSFSFSPLITFDSFSLRVLPMHNGVGPPTGYIINGPTTSNPGQFG